jgi:hypothetical protein
MHSKYPLTDYIRALRVLAQHGLAASGRAEEVE